MCPRVFGIVVPCIQRCLLEWKEHEAVKSSSSIFLLYSVFGLPFEQSDSSQYFLLMKDTMETCELTQVILSMKMNAPLALSAIFLPGPKATKGSQWLFCHTADNQEGNAVMAGIGIM
jgi:hypothetical protein